jgi:hypothetical protein
VGGTPRLTLILDGAALPAARAPGGALHLFARMALAAGEAARFRVALAGEGHMPAELSEAEVVHLPQEGLAAPLPLGPPDVLFAADPRAVAAAERLRAAQAAHFGMAPAPVRQLAAAGPCGLAVVDALAARLLAEWGVVGREDAAGVAAAAACVAAQAPEAACAGC